MTAECLACSKGVTEQEYCQSYPYTAGCATTTNPTCALCSTCGGDYTEDGGRSTYFQSGTTQFASYDKECRGNMQVRTGDNSVVYSPHLCCARREGSLLEVDATSEVAEAQGSLLEVDATSEVAGAQATGSGSDGSCRICSYCGGDYPVRSGVLTSIGNGAPSHSQNFEAYGGQCSGGASSAQAPPGGDFCCAPSKSNTNEGVCSVCQGSCGGEFTEDGGTLSFVAGKDMKFEGRGYSCGGSIASRVGYDQSSYPHICCKQV